MKLPVRAAFPFRRLHTPSQPPSIQFKPHLSVLKESCTFQQEYPPNVMQVRQQILEASLKHVPTYGWTRQALSKGVEDAGLLPSISHGLISQGPIELIHYFVSKSTRDMSAQMNQMELEKMKVTHKIRTACRIRLGLLDPYIAQWPQALAIMAQPPHVPSSLSHLAELIDEMWYLAGDRSVDMNWYTKRALLTGVYTSSEWYMTQDASPNYQETWDFLDRRLQDVAEIGKTSAQVRNVMDFGVKSIQGFISSASCFHVN